ncbi:redoxin domain-containing protein [Reyranella sp. CPCC 100927]|uniref:redoxin domain-containing protein n=1 Tax=Reyranella sp. CPCC 100927 TaxID=2599616 RepID=UPI0011B80B45|nr:redoxin domain-containing protein [Reyranella sp. CPCC 100927]TWS97086.1 redoxin domain-containing protein [Reyranella sp. CPCC 100927]
MPTTSKPAPEWRISEWINSETPLTLEALRGKVVVAFAFQMLCPGCVQESIPQAKRVHEIFDGNRVATIGLHTVFEHHDAMRPVSLKAFIHENRIQFPVGVDAYEGDDPLPATMRAYNMQGTPTLLLIDRAGRLRRQAFGHVADLALGAEIMALLVER